MSSLADPSLPNAPYSPSGNDAAVNDPFSVGAPAYDPFLPGKVTSHGSGLPNSVPGIPSYPGDARAKRRPARFTDVTISIVLPWLVFFLVVSLFLFAYHELGQIVWILIALCTGLAMLFLVLGACARHGAFLAIGFLCLASVGIGTAVGLWIQAEYLDRYWELDAGHEYSTVHPTSDAKQTHGASVIRFAPGTFVDDRRTLGFVTGGGILCLAPVVAPLEASATVQYWAVGEDCCEMRCNFDCGSAREPDAATAVAERRVPLYDRAIAEAASVYGLNTTKDAQLVSFVNDPAGVIADIWDEALTIALIAMIMDLAMCALAGLVIARILASPGLAPYDRDK